MAKKSGGKEAKITSGGIETSVQGFFGNITSSAPFTSTYGDHKSPGSEMLPVTASGRGGGKEYFRSKILKASSSTGKGK